MFKCLKMLCVAALAGTLGLIWAPDAEAQTASDLDCKKCVGTRDIAKKAVSRSRLKNNTVSNRKIRNGAVSQSKLDFDVATQDELDDLKAEVEAVSLGQGDIMSHLLPKTVFVTSDTFTGNLGGLAGADVICQAAADDPAAVVPSGDYVAWLSTDTVDARDRITQTLGPYVRADGRVIAKSYADLINTDNADLLSPIELDEFGDTMTGRTWTGTDTTGIGFPGFTCSGWTSGVVSESGVMGASNIVTGNWTNLFAQECDTTLSLYCVQK